MEKFKATPAQPNENSEFLENHSSNKEILKKKLFDIQIKLKNLDNSIYNISLSTDSKTRKQFFNERRKISSEYDLISNEYKKCINTEYRKSLEHENPPSFSFESLKKCLLHEAENPFFNTAEQPEYSIIHNSTDKNESQKILKDLLLNKLDIWNSENENEIINNRDNQTEELRHTHNKSSVLNHFKHIIIRTIKDSKQISFIPTLIDFLVKQKNQTEEGHIIYFIQDVQDALSNIDIPTAAAQLLLLAQSKNEDERRIALTLLYKIEGKQINITEEGLDYLQKRFDLGEEYNKKEYIGQRITSQGQIGIFESSNKKLIKYFNLEGIEKEQHTIKAKMLDITYETLFTPLPGESEEEKAEREKFLNHFQETYSGFFHDDFFKTNSFHFNDLSFSEQTSFIRLYESASKKEKNNIEVFARTYGLNGLRSLLIMGADNSTAMGEVIIDLGKELAPKDAQLIFSEFNNLIETVNISTVETIFQISKEYQDIQLTEEDIRYALLSRGRDYFKEMSIQLKHSPENKQLIINKFIEELRSEELTTSFFRGEFKAVVELLNRKNINLASFSTLQSIILQNFFNTKHKETAFRTLSRLDKLEPIPEIHWEVDRGPEEYNRRLGININNLLENFQDFSLTGKPKILLEIGPGSGAHKYSRQKNRGYEDYGLSDRIYYPLAPLIEKLIDFDTLEKDIHQTLSTDERKKLADFIYKTLIIQEGQTTLDNFSYDNEAQQLLRKDINNLKIILPKIASRLKNTTSVPETISSRNEEGNVIYPNKISVDDFSPSLFTAKKNLDNNFTNYLVKDWENKDYFNLIDAFPANTMIGDIKDINRLADNQIDVELAVRSTVYSRHEDYENFLTTLVDKLKTGGVALDDSIRDNDGWYYRFAEIIKAREQFKNETEILVILGPGFPGEDYQQERVPLSLIITKEGSSKELIASQLEPNCEVISFDELTNDEKYLASLDSTGLSYTRAQAAKKTTSSLAA